MIEGDIVALKGEKGEFYIVAGKGGSLHYPMIEVKSTTSKADIRVVESWKLRLIRRSEHDDDDDDDDDVNESLLGKWNLQFRASLASKSFPIFPIYEWISNMPT